MDRLRRRIANPSTPSARLLLKLLIEQDGSTTRLCEALAGTPVQVCVLSQRVVDVVPAQVRKWLPGDRFIERITSLAANGEVMTDNLVYIALEGLDAPLWAQLLDASLPIGRLMAGRWLRREAVRLGDEVLDRLWRTVGQPDPGAMRCYRLLSHDGPAMLVCETFRRGVWPADAGALAADRVAPRELA
jgi:chorismate-pyruvate lyase